MLSARHLVSCKSRRCPRTYASRCRIFDIQLSHRNYWSLDSSPSSIGESQRRNAESSPDGAVRRRGWVAFQNWLGLDFCHRLVPHIALNSGYVASLIGPAAIPSDSSPKEQKIRRRRSNLDCLGHGDGVLSVTSYPSVKDPSGNLRMIALRSARRHRWDCPSRHHNIHRIMREGRPCKGS